MNRALRLLVLLVAVWAQSHVACAPANATLKADIPPMTDGLRRDRAALVALRNTIYINGFGQSRIKSGWSKRPSANPCWPDAWPHTICVGYRVVSINLAGMGVRAANLPAQLTQMDRLIWLDLSGNDITGTLPDAWGRRLSFVRLQTLNLQDNSLYGTLPRWNAKGAWAKLTTLNLQGNNFYGQLPLTWAGKNTPLRKLVTLDLSNNYLGKRDGADDEVNYLPLPEGATDWGTASSSANPFPALQTLDLSENFFQGTLPNWGKQFAYPSLKTLDLRYNQLTGALPVAWGGRGAFPRLVNLYLSGNNLGDPSAPGGLPLGWTRLTVPRAFPSLQYMMLYPGNDNVCAWLSGNTQGGAGYKVVDDGLVEYSAAADNVWLCPDPEVDNSASGASATPAVGQPVAMGWTGPGSASAGFACGFRTVIVDGSDTEVFSYDWQVRPDPDPDLTINTGTTPATYTAASGTWVPADETTYTLRVYTLNCNKYLYTPAEVQFVGQG